MISVNNDWIGLHNVHIVGKTSKVHRAVVKAYLWSLPMMDGDCGDDCNDNCLKLLLCTVTCDNEKDYNPGNEPRVQPELGSGFQRH